MLYRSLLILFFSILSAQAYSTIIDRDWYTEDTISGLDWMDITETSGKSFDYVSTQFGLSGDYAGFRYATKVELLQFLVNADVPDVHTPSSFSMERWNAIDDLLTLIGYNESDFMHIRATGFTGDETFVSGTTEYIPSFALSVWYDTHPNGEWSWISTQGGYVSSTESSNIGSWLVRDIPEPSILALFSLGVLSFAFTRRKKT